MFPSNLNSWLQHMGHLEGECCDGLWLDKKMKFATLNPATLNMGCRAISGRPPGLKLWVKRSCRLQKMKSEFRRG